MPLKIQLRPTITLMRDGTIIQGHLRRTQHRPHFL